MVIVKKYEVDVFDFKSIAKFNLSTLFWLLVIDLEACTSNNEILEKLVQNYPWLTPG